MKKSLALLLLITMLLSLAACAGNGGDEADGGTVVSGPVPMKSVHEAENSESPGSFYARELIALPDPDAYVIEAIRSGPYIYMLAKSTENEPFIYRMEIETQSFEKLELSGEHVIQRISPGIGDGLCALSMDEEGSYHVLSLSPGGGTTEFRLPMLDEYERSLITWIYPIESGYIAFTTSDILALDEQGKLKKDLGKCDGSGLCLPDADGGILVVASVPTGAGTASLTRVQKFSRELEQLSSWDSERQFTSFYGDHSGGIIACDSGCVYRFDYENDQAIPIINTSSSAMQTGSLICLGEELFFSLSVKGPALWRPSAAPAPTLITLATYNMDVALFHKIREYNEESSKYRIEIVDYGKFDQSYGDGLGLTRLQTEITAGFAPDLYDLNELPAQLYARRGIFEDLKPYFSGSSPIQYEDFIPNAVKQLEQDGALYYICPSFDAMTFCSNKSITGGSSTWTTEQFLKAVEGYEPKEVFGPSMTQNKFLMYILVYLGDEYLDTEDLQCDFNEESFYKLLDFTTQLPAEYDPNKELSQEIALAYMGQQPILNWWAGNGGHSTTAFAAVSFGDAYQFIGFPGAGSNEIALSPSSLLAMSVDSENKEGAMDFIYYILRDENQLNFLSFPIVESALEKKFDKWEENFLRDETSKLGTSYEGALMTIEAPSTPETAAAIEGAMMDIIGRMDCLSVFDHSQLEILITECQGYFAGDKTLEQAVKGIQSKMQIYVSEQYG